jgi:hypothetical protein
MSEVSMVVLLEAGQVRSLATAAFRLPLPDCLLWGPEVIPRIEAYAQPIDSWPPAEDLESAVVIDRDGKRLIRAGASSTFLTPYQLALFDKMLESVWPGYRIESTAIDAESLEQAVGRSTPTIDDSLTERLVATVIGGPASRWEEDEYDDEEEEQVAPQQPPPEHRRQPPQNGLIESQEHGSTARDEDGEFDDSDPWWVSVRVGNDQADAAGFRHFIGSFDWQNLRAAGPEMISQLASLPDAKIPDEEAVQHGIVLDACKQTISLWSHPRGCTDALALGDAWTGWSLVPWSTNGFRRQVQASDCRDFIPATDAAVLSEFVPYLAEQPDLAQVIGGIKSSFRSAVRKGFGCLAICLAIPAALAWAVSGSWQGPFAFAAGLWLVVYVGYRFMLAKLKQSFLPLARNGLDQQTLLPKLAPDSKAQRVQIIDDALAAARLPDFAEIVAYAESMDIDDE